MQTKFYVNMNDRMLGDTIAIECRNPSQQNEVLTMARSENREMSRISASSKPRKGATVKHYGDFTRFHYTRLAWRLDPKSNRSDKERMKDKQLWSELREKMVEEIRFVQSCCDPAMIFVNRDVEIWVEFLPDGKVTLAVIENRVVTERQELPYYVHVGKIADLLMKYDPNPSDWMGADFGLKPKLLGSDYNNEALQETRLAKCFAQDRLAEANDSAYLARVAFKAAMRLYGLPVATIRPNVNTATNLLAAMIQHEQAKQALNAANQAWVNVRWPELA